MNVAHTSLQQQQQQQVKKQPICCVLSFIIAYTQVEQKLVHNYTS